MMRLSDPLQNPSWYNDAFPENVYTRVDALINHVW